MDEQSLRDWLTLLRAPGVGPATLNPLLDQYGDARAVLRARASLPAAVSRAIDAVDTATLEQDLQWLAGPRNHLVTRNDAAYPALLQDLSDAPVALWLHGEPAVLTLPQLAVVGSRNPTAGGTATARDFARHLASHGLAICSGLAIGIDTAAHQGALDGGGVTVAVTGTGLDRVYPASNRELAYRIAERGALVSEFPPGTPARPGNFPRRNRIISGLSVGTLVVEAALKSGSLITARLALEQGRELFAIPGSIHNPLARGCHALIREGAKLVDDAGHIVEELGAALGGLMIQEAGSQGAQAGKPAELDEDYAKLLENMGFDPISTDRLIERTGFSAEAVSSMLLLLELEGHVSSVPGGLFARTGS